MHRNPVQMLFAIDQAIRNRAPSSTPDHMGGLAELLQRDPDIEVWLSWLCDASQQRTCGALEEIVQDLALMPPKTSRADTASDSEEAGGSGGGATSGGGLSVVLVGPDGDPVTPISAGIQRLRFTIVAPGNYRLFTADRTLLWSQTVAGMDQTHPPDVWRLAAAPVEDPVPPGEAEETADSASSASHTPHRCIQRWPLAPWSLMLELNRSGSHTWMDVTQE